MYSYTLPLEANGDCFSLEARFPYKMAIFDGVRAVCGVAGFISHSFRQNVPKTDRLALFTVYLGNGNLAPGHGIPGDWAD